MFLALGDPSAVIMIRESTLDARMSWRARVPVDAMWRCLPMVQFQVAGKEQHIGADGLGKRIYVTEAGGRIHLNCVGGILAEGCIGPKGWVASEVKSAASAKGPQHRSRCHVARGREVAERMRARDRRRGVVLMIALWASGMN